MIVRTGTLAALAGVTTALLLVACGQSPSSGGGAPLSAPSGPPKPAGEITYVVASFTSEILDPSQGANVTQYLGPMYENLFLNWPGTGEARPFLLESGRMAEDSLSWTFKLRDGVRFSNGDPMTADDVKFSLDRFRSPEAKSSSSAILRGAIQDIQVVDPRTVRLNLKSPLLTLPLLLAGDIGNDGIVLPKKYIEQVGWEQFGQKPIGSGPYKLKEHRAGEAFIFEAQENHWRATPKFTRVTILKVAEDSTRLAMLRTGQADMAELGVESRKQVDQSGLKALVVPYETSWRVPFYGATGSYSDNPLKKLEVRKALNLSINRTEMVDGLYAGAAEAAAYAHSIPGYSIGAPKLPVPPYDPAEARRLLQQGGYPDGFELTLYLPDAGCSKDDSRRFGEVLASYWAKIGVRTRLVPIDYAIFRPQVRGANLSPQVIGAASTFCTAGSQIAPRDLTTFWYGKGEWKLADVADAEIERMNAAKSQEEMVRWAEAAYKKLYDNYAAIGVFHGGIVFGATPKLADIPVTPGFAGAFTTWFIWEKPDNPIFK